jgi:hypothetical protein
MTQNDAGTGEQIKDKASDVAGQAQEKAQQAAGQARDQLRSQVDQRSTEAGRRISGQGSDLRAVGEQLRAQGKDGPAKLADQAADRVERAGHWLTNSDADRILNDIEEAARSNPWAVMAGGLALGFAASRFLKASSSERYQTRDARRTPDYPALPQRTPAGDPLRDAADMPLASPSPSPERFGSAGDERFDTRLADGVPAGRSL